MVACDEADRPLSDYRAMTDALAAAESRLRELEAELLLLRSKEGS